MIAFSQKESIKSLMASHKGDFDNDLFNNLLTRADLAHLLLSEVHQLTDKLAAEFPDVIKVQTIG